MDGDREFYSLFLVLVLVLVFKREGAEIRGIGSVHSFLLGSGLRLDWEWLSSWLGVTFRLGCKSTMKGSRRLEDRDG